MLQDAQILSSNIHISVTAKEWIYVYMTLLPRNKILMYYHKSLDQLYVTHSITTYNTNINTI